MNIVNKLTVRNLKHNKKRTLVTMFGTIISVAMIIAVATIGVSFMDMLQRTTMQSTGEWHVSYEDVYKEQIETIEKDDLTEAVSLVKELGFAPLGEEGTDSNPYMYVREMDQEGFERFPVTLTDGRLPDAADEVVLQEEFVQLNEGRYEIGSTIQLEIGERYTEEEGYGELDLNSWIITDSNGEVAESVQIETERDYTVVGIIEQPNWVPMWGPVYSALSYTDRDLLSEDEQVTAMIVASQINGSIYEKAETLEENIGNKSTFNTDLLMYHLVTGNEGFHTVIYGLLSIIITVIVIGSVALIFNAFAISVSERSRQLGMLSSVGATKKQKRNSVFFEGFLIGIISIPIGLLAGIAGIGITFSIINGILEESFGLPEALRLVVTPTSLLIATGVSALTIFISSYIPALRASRITAIDAIRQSNDIKLSKRKVKTSKLVRSLFGMEAEIGLKNLKRNKRRYQVTVFSLMISIVLFLTVSYFTANLTRSFEMTQSEMKYDVSVDSNGEDDLLAGLLENEQFMNTVNEYSVERNFYGDIQAAIEVERMSNRLQNQFDDLLEEEEQYVYLDDGRFPYYVNLVGMNQENFAHYAERVELDLDDLNGVDFPAIIVNQITYPDDDAGQYVETEVLNANVGQSIDLFYYDWENDTRTEMDPVEIVALTDQSPMGSIYYDIQSLVIVVPEENFDYLLEQTPGDNARHALETLYYSSEDPNESAALIEEFDTRGQLNVFNYHEMKQSEQQMVLIISIFTYGFITLITLISVANIFNTISTSIALRKREFAMLKSIGMTPKSFNKMIYFESIFYGLKSLLYGLPLGIGVMYLIYWRTQTMFSYSFSLPWIPIAIVIVAVFLIVGAAMMYSISKVKKENIIDGLKQENI